MNSSPAASPARYGQAYMKTLLHHTVWLLPILLLACSSTKETKSYPSQISNQFKTSLAERQIKESNYFVHLPANYEITETEGPDFSVDYFRSRDTTTNLHFNAGIYFGGFPTPFPPDNDSCQTTKLKDSVLGNKVTWVIYKCSKRYKIQTIVNNKLNGGGFLRLHIFGSATTYGELIKIPYVFSTLRIQ